MNERIEDNIVIAEFDHKNGNSITLDALLKLREIIKKVNETEELKGIILTGKDKVFSSGFDLPMFLKFKDLDEVVEFFAVEEEILLELFMCSKPVVSALNGHTVAGGLIFALAADYRIAKNHPKIKVGMSEIKIGLPLSLAQQGVVEFGLDSKKKFRDIMYFGQMYDVTQAKDLGIIDELVEADDLMDSSKKIITTWIDNPGRSFIRMKQVLRTPTKLAIEESMEIENWQEALNIFFDKGTRGALEMIAKMMGAS